MIKYTSNLDDIQEEMLEGFFVDWPNPPTKATHYQILNKSYYFVVAIDSDSNMVVGFINVVSDGILSAYIPLLEVLPDYKNQGIGKELLKQTFTRLKSIYMVDLLCDEKMVSYYSKQGMSKASGALIRNYDSLTSR